MHFKIDSKTGRWCVTSLNLIVRADGTTSALVGIRPFSVLSLGCERGDSTYVSLRRRQRNRAADRRGREKSESRPTGTSLRVLGLRRVPAPAPPLPPRPRPGSALLSSSTSLA